jgi:hypothetical protein
MFNGTTQLSNGGNPTFNIHQRFALQELGKNTITVIIMQEGIFHCHSLRQMNRDIVHAALVTHQLHQPTLTNLIDRHFIFTIGLLLPFFFPLRIGLSLTKSINEYEETNINILNLPDNICLYGHNLFNCLPIK